MKLEIELSGKKHTLETAPRGERVRWLVDGKEIEADAIEVSPGVYSVLIGGDSIEVRVDPTATGLQVTTGPTEFQAVVRDPREWQRGRTSATETEGRQKVLAPMPGKIVRVLVSAGDAVKAGQGIVVVEAMKMQNEIRATKSGVVERLTVTEGQAVNAGDAIAIIA